MDVRHPAPLSFSGELAATRLNQLGPLLEGEQFSTYTSSAARTTAEALFSRAPEDFLRRTTTESLTAITKECIESISHLQRRSLPYVVDTRTHREGDRAGMTTICICVTDRPFVVDSVVEKLKSVGISHHIALHPILRISEQLVSLTYLEIDEIESDVERDRLTLCLEETMAAVMAVTNDFQAMRQSITDFAPNAERRLLDWLLDGGFVMVGSAIWSGAWRDEFGVLRSGVPNSQTILGALEREAELCPADGVLASRLPMKSPVHRRVFLECFTFDVNGERLVVIGMLTSRAALQDVMALPYASDKAKSLLAAEDLLPNSHDYKEAISILNSVPTFDLFRAPFEELRECLRMMMAIQRRSETRVHAQSVSFDRFVAITVVMPKERFASYLTTEIEDYLNSRFRGRIESPDSVVMILEETSVAIFILLPRPNESLDFAELEQAIADRTLTWEDRLFHLLSQQQGLAQATRLLDFYETALPEEYRAARTPHDAVLDIERLERLTEELGIDIAIAPSESSSDTTPLYDLRIYKRGGGLTLSALFPLLENSGFHILDETVTNVVEGKQTWASIYTLLVRPKFTAHFDLAKTEKTLISALKLIFAAEAENDSFNALLVAPGLGVRDVALCRTIAHYLWQIKAAPSEGLIASTFVENTELIAVLVEAFYARFDPTRSDTTEKASECFSQARTRYFELLKKVASLPHDRVLRAAWNVVESTVRTNYFQGREPFRIALKIRCDLILQMPRPRPMFEIFVCSPQIEGVHLRGGHVARGGLRWSERPDDFRTEILGLMKTQTTKNAIIVPVGAKGGFIVKGKAKPAPDDVVACYRLFIRSLLEVTDNRAGGGVLHPAATLIYDGPDPYFVVAADKGTATFSDLANQIALDEFQLWIGDAFASGGSQGYSHKKYGITAKGAWAAACVHFRELGINVEKQDFTIVGIGDMSGDVFGNGLILSDHAKLLGAFDHRHVFVDPDPDPRRSFAERKRLFELPRSSWMDYDRTLISKGGGVFSRDEKSIILTPEMRRSFGIDITAESLSGQELIQHILRAPVDLIWNGGIGTYVKASSQDHIHAADRANDDVRIDAPELRCRAVAEGGNLGFTQQARIEYALAGGRINTDAIDNSAGVDLSDHEVNLKILLSAPVARQELTTEQRTALLLECVDDVCEAVVLRNRAQSTALSLIVAKSASRIQFQLGHIRALEKAGILDRRGEGLPDDDVLLRRADDKQGVTRPEAALLLAYSKMSIFPELLESDVPSDTALEHLLFAYFPEKIATRFPEDIRQHPLRKEIISTQIVNLLFEQMDPSFIFRLSEETGARSMSIVRAFLAGWEILDAQNVLNRLRQIERPENIREIHWALHRLSSALYGVTRWLIRNRPQFESIGELRAFFQEQHMALLRSTRSLIPANERGRFEEHTRSYVAGGFENSLAELIASLPYATPLLEVVDVARREGVVSTDVAKLYSQIGAELQIGNLLAKASKMEVTDYWDMTAWRSLLSDLRNVIGAIVRTIYVETHAVSPEAVALFFQSHADELKRVKASIQEFEKKQLSLGALYVLSQRLQALTAPRQNALPRL